MNYSLILTSPKSVVLTQRNLLLNNLTHIKTEDMKNLKLIGSLIYFICILLITHSGIAQAPAIQWQNTIGGSATDYLRSLQQTTDGGYILGGNSDSDISGDKTEASLGGFDYWIIKLFSDSKLTIYSDAPIQNNLLINLYPNPAKDNIIIETDYAKEKTIYLMNNLGQVIQTIHTSEKSIAISLNTIASGLYYIKIEAGVNSYAQKFIIE